MVLGLGNPGARYVRTRHNAGWRVVETLVDRWKARPAGETLEYRAWQWETSGRVVDLVVPLTLMNRSGAAIESWKQRHELDPEWLLVVTDDVYLPVGALRIRAHGSSGGHRGLESLEAALATREYPRLRIGVGATPSEALRDHVLEELVGEEQTALDEGIARAAEAVECWLAEGLLVAMNRFNRKLTEEDVQS